MKYKAKDISYTGWFVINKTDETALKQFLDSSFSQTPSVFHVTHKFKPQEVDFSLFGQFVLVKVVGYAKTDKMEAIHVAPTGGLNPNDSLCRLTDLQALFDETENPAHISLRKADDSVKWFQCGLLPFDKENIPSRFKLEEFAMVYGAFMKDGSVVVNASRFE